MSTTYHHASSARWHFSQVRDAPRDEAIVAWPEIETLRSVRPWKSRAAPRRTLTWIGISLAVHATGLACCAWYGPAIGGAPPGLHAAGAPQLQGSFAAVPFGEGFGEGGGTRHFQISKARPRRSETTGVPAPVSTALDPPSERRAAVQLVRAAPDDDARPALPPAIVPELPERVLRVRGAAPDPQGIKTAGTPQIPRFNVGGRRAGELVGGAVVGWPAPGAEASTTGAGGRGAAGGVGVPRLVYNPPPDYPPEALAARQTGRVLLRVMVQADGTVHHATLQRSSGVESLDRAALDVIRRWRFAPLELGADVWEVIVPIRFTIEEP